ncbi:zinc knuckle CX2CX4HX4C containing protein [Tanacetum coccineum]
MTRRSKCITRVPLKLGDSVYTLTSKKNKQKNDVMKIDKEGISDDYGENCSGSNDDYDVIKEESGETKKQRNEVENGQELVNEMNETELGKKSEIKNEVGGGKQGADLNMNINSLFFIPAGMNDNGDEAVIFDEELVEEGCQNLRGISTLASMLGRHVMMDNVTATMYHKGTGSAGIKERDKIDLLLVMPFKYGKLPVRYLGIPLLAKKLVVNDCKVLVDRVENNGRKTSVWYDKWCKDGPLSSAISKRDIYEAILQDEARVVDIITNGQWMWPDGMGNHDKLQDVINEMAGNNKVNCIGMVVNKLILVAVVYFIWQEMNLRMFKDEKRTTKDIIKIIYQNVRSKLMTVRARKTSRVDVIAWQWDLQNQPEIYDSIIRDIVMVSEIFESWVLFDSLMDDANNANAGMYVRRSACFSGEDLLRSVTKRTVARMNKMTGKGDSKVNPKVSIGLDSENAQPRMAVRGSLNPNSGNPNSGRVDANSGGNDQDVGCIASYPDTLTLILMNASSVSVNMHTSSPVDEILIHSIDDVAALFSVPLNFLKEIDAFTKDLEVGKYDLWLELTKEARSRITVIISNRWDTFLNMQKSSPIVNDNLSGKVSPSDPIAQAVDINIKSTSYAEATGASAKDQQKVNSNFRPLVANPVFKGVNISIPRKVVEKVSTHFEHTLYGYFNGKRMEFLVVEYYARKNWAKHGMKRIMMNTKGFFFFKFDSRAGLEAVLEGGPWLIQDGISLIAMFIGKPVMLDSYTSCMCNDLWGRSIFARCLVKVNSEADLVDVVTIGIPSLTGDGFTKETIRVDPPIATTSNVVTPTVVKTNDGFQTLGNKKKRKGKYELKATNSEPKKEATNVCNASKSSSMLKSTGTSSTKDNITTSNSYSSLENEEDEDEERVENVYDKLANLFPNKKN